MSVIIVFMMYAVIIAIVAAVAYLVIKKAVKDALCEYDREKHN